MPPFLQVQPASGHDRASSQAAAATTCHTPIDIPACSQQIAFGIYQAAFFTDRVEQQLEGIAVPGQLLLGIS